MVHRLQIQMVNKIMRHTSDEEQGVGSTTIAKRYLRRIPRRRLLNRKSQNLYSSGCLLLLIPISSVAFSSAFQSTSLTPRKQNIDIEYSLSQTAMRAFPGFNNNDGNDDNDGDNNKNDDWNPNNIFESFKNLFGNKDTGSSQDKGMVDNSNTTPLFSQFFQPPGLSSEHYYDELGYSEDYDLDEDDEDELPAGTSLLFKIQAKQLKPGGLRLFLMFYLLGMQNTPDKNTWRADQRLMSVNASPKGYEDNESEDEPEDKKYVLEMLYDVDRTGMLQIELLPEKAHKQAQIRIYRCGSRPSTSYLMQESVIVDGVLDELQNIAGEKDLATTIPRSDNPDIGTENQPEIAEEDRLLITDPPNAIEAARESLAFS